MPVPGFTPHGLLPPGVHPCSLAEAAAALCTSEHRTNIWTGLEGFIGWAANLVGPTALYVDGSYVTDKPIPGDIDLVVDISGCDAPGQAQWLQAWADSHEHVKNTYHVDFYPVVMGQGNDFVAFFQYVRAEEALRRGIGLDVRKGILRVTP
ncbi:DUF6932 family protein [Brevundimonas huaxiensis]|uniref:DUF6932 family protein n=1 Tax=Brevundimonas huaxiensis TaxID=2725493 RepID=UPI0037439BC8